MELCVQKLSSFVAPHDGQMDPLVLDFVTMTCVNITRLTISVREKQGLLDTESIYPLNVAVPLFGYVAPFLVLLTAILNSLVVVTLAQRRMRSSTSIILASVAICDMLTAVTQLPWFMYAYTFGGYAEYPSYFWCIVYRFLASHIPVIFHTSSVWFTLMLAVHRFLGIQGAKVPKYHQMWGKKQIVACTVGIVTASTVIHSLTFILHGIEPAKTIGKKLLIPSGFAWVNTCSFTYRSNSFDAFMHGYKWFRALCISVIPCLLLTVFNILLVRITYRSYAYRRSLMRGSQFSEYRDLRETLRITSMLLIILITAFIIEIPVAFFFISDVLKDLYAIHIMTENAIRTLTAVSTFLILLSHPVTFVAYYAMSSGFRRTFKELLGCCRRNNSVGHKPVSSSSRMTGRGTENLELE